MTRMNRAACGALLALSPWLSIGCSSTGQRPLAAARTQQAADQRLQTARQYERSGQLQKAQELYAELQQESPRNGDLAHRLGIIHTRLGQHPQAAGQFEKALRSEPNDPRLLSDVGYSEFLRGDLAAAAGHLERALELQQDNRRAVNNLALVYGHQGRFDESLALFRRCASEADALASLANIHRQRGDHDLALACYEEILELDPTNASASAAMSELKPMVREQAPEVAAGEAPIRSIPDDAAPLPAEEFLQVNRQEPLAAAEQSTAESRHPLDEVAQVESAPVEAADAPVEFETPMQVAEVPFEFEAPVEVTDAPRSTAPAVDDFALPVIQPGYAEPTVQPDAAQVTVESGFQIESNEVETRVVAPQTAAVIPDEESFEMPQPATPDVAEAPEFELPAEAVPQGPAAAVTVLGMSGYCPVSLRNEREMVGGVEAWEAEYKGVTYRFATPEALAEFHVDPEVYIPVAGGLDVVAVREGRDVTAGSLEHATWFRDRLYLFASSDSLARFQANARTFADGF